MRLYLACSLLYFLVSATVPDPDIARTFLVLTVQSLTMFAGTIVMLAAGQLGAGVLIAGYGVVAQRRVYGGSWPVAVLKGLGVGAVYLALWSAVVLGVTLWTARA